MKSRRGRPKGTKKNFLGDPDRHLAVLTLQLSVSFKISDRKARSIAIAINEGRICFDYWRRPAWQIDQNDVFFSTSERLKQKMAFTQRRAKRLDLPCGYTTEEVQWLMDMGLAVGLALTPGPALSTAVVITAIEAIAKRHHEMDFAERVMLPLAYSGGLAGSLTSFVAGANYAAAMLSFGC